VFGLPLSRRSDTVFGATKKGHPHVPHLLLVYMHQIVLVVKPVLLILDVNTQAKQFVELLFPFCLGHVTSREPNLIIVGRFFHQTTLGVGSLGLDLICTKWKRNRDGLVLQDLKVSSEICPNALASSMSS
jgi:hypothetical protein